MLIFKKLTIKKFLFVTSLNIYTSHKLQSLSVLICLWRSVVWSVLCSVLWSSVVWNVVWSVLRSVLWSSVVRNVVWSVLRSVLWSSVLWSVLWSVLCHCSSLRSVFSALPFSSTKWHITINSFLTASVNFMVSVGYTMTATNHDGHKEYHDGHSNENVKN